MSEAQSILNVIAYAIFLIGPIVIWPKKENFIAWLSLPLFFTAYLIPIIFFNFQDFVTTETINQLTYINILGSLGFVIGLIIGRLSRVFNGKLLIVAHSYTNGYSNKMLGRIHFLMLLACLGMTISFAWMGFVPMFADDPFLAKFFKGGYKEKYDQVSILYRFSQVILITIMPLALAFVGGANRTRFFLPVFWGLLLFMLSLTRSEVGSGLMLLVLAWSLKSRWRVLFYIIFAIIIYGFAGLAYLLLGFVGEVNQTEVISHLSGGMTDILDQLTFLAAFNPEKNLSYGLTFMGGLVPGNFYYNPSVFTLSITNNGADVGELASGGFRLPVSLMGFVAFSYGGAFIVPLVSGFLLGGFVNFFRKIKFTSITQAVFLMVCYKAYVTLWTEFYLLSYGKVISIGILLYVYFGKNLFFRSKWKLNFQNPAEKCLLK